MGGFLGIGGSATKTDRSTTLQGYGGLENIFNFGIPTAKNLVSSGSDAISNALGYWTKLMSGNRAAVGQAVAPQTNSILAQSDAAKRQQAASGTARGGGAAVPNATRESNTLAQVNNLMFGATSDAAKQEGGLGVATTGAGTNLLSTSGTAAADLTNAAVKSQQESDEVAEQQGAAAGKLAAALLFGV